MHLPSQILPLLDGLRVENIDTDSKIPLLSAVAPPACCQVCTTPSPRIHWSLFTLDNDAVAPYPGCMEVHLSPDLQAKVDQWATETGRPVGELVEDAMVAYFFGLAQARESLDNRYDDLKSGRVTPIDGEEAFALLKARTEAQRSQRA